AGGFDRHDAEILDQFVGVIKAVDVDDEGGEDGGGDVADARNRGKMVVFGKAVDGFGEQNCRAFWTSAAIAQLADLVADKFLGGRSVERSDGRSRGREQ